MFHTPSTWLLIANISFLFLFLILLALALYRLHIFVTIITSLFFDYTRNRVIDDYADKTVRIVEEGNLPSEFDKPITSQDKFDLACSILTDSLSNIGFDTSVLHIPAIITAKVNQLYHGEIPGRFKHETFSKN